MIITSKSNAIIKAVSSLSEKKFRKQYGQYVVEGIKPVNECISAGCKIDNIICTEQTAGAYKNPIIVSESVFKSLSSEKTPQGVLAVVEIEDKPLREPFGNCLLLDCLQDPGNLGTVLRTANAAGYRDIYLINCTDPYSPKAVRASMSGIFFVNLYFGTYSEVFEALKNYPLICADMAGEDIFSFRPPENYCLCIGNEGNGISNEVLKRANYTVRIPMQKTCESLNAAVSAGIAMYTLNNNRNNAR